MSDRSFSAVSPFLTILVCHAHHQNGIPNINHNHHKTNPRSPPDPPNENMTIVYRREAIPVSIHRATPSHTRIGDHVHMPKPKRITAQQTFEGVPNMGFRTVIPLADCVMVSCAYTCIFRMTGSFPLFPQRPRFVASPISSTVIDSIHYHRSAETLLIEQKEAGSEVR